MKVFECVVATLMNEFAGVIVAAFVLAVGLCWATVVKTVVS